MPQGFGFCFGSAELPAQQIQQAAAALVAHHVDDVEKTVLDGEIIELNGDHWIIGIWDVYYILCVCIYIYMVYHDIISWEFHYGYHGLKW